VASAIPFTLITPLSVKFDGDDLTPPILDSYAVCFA